MRDGKLLQIGPRTRSITGRRTLRPNFHRRHKNSRARSSRARQIRHGSISAMDGRAEAALLHSSIPATRCWVALRPENIAIGRQDDANAFTASVRDRRYQGTQTIYDIDLFGHRLEVLELAPPRATRSGSRRRFCLPRRPAGPSAIPVRHPTISYSTGSFPIVEIGQKR